MPKTLSAQLVDLVASEVGTGGARLALTLSACCCSSCCQCLLDC
jgi:hypothetical protein